MNKEFWNTRYNEEGYAYGLSPNDFLSQQPIAAGQKILSLAEGEGRNALWLASQGALVTAVDFSEEGLNKLRRLAAQKGLEIETVCADLNEFEFPENTYDAVVLIFGHFNSELRRKILHGIRKTLKPGGRLIMEVYHKDQIAMKTGGPGAEEFLYTEQILENELSGMQELHIEKLEREIHEGEFHNGPSVVLQVLAIA